MEGHGARRLIVGVMGSGTEEHSDLAEPLGEWLAAMGFHLLTGGGGGVMTSASRGFGRAEAREGLVLGVIPGTIDDGRYHPLPGYPNDFVEIPIRTHLPLSGDRGEDERSRNHINVLTADLVVALPGSAGTASEVRLALKYGRPVLLYLGNVGRIEGLRGDEAPRASDLEDVKRWLTMAAARLEGRES